MRRSTAWVWFVLVLPFFLVAAAPGAGQTVYSAGWYFDKGVSHACYWKGLARVELAGDGVHSAGAQSIVVSGTTVYAAGYYSDGTREIPCYWTGTKKTDLAGAGKGNGGGARG